MTGMAEIIAEAARKSDAAHWPEAAAIALTAAGFGLVREAGAVALEEAADDYRHYETPNARLYLRARAVTVRGES